LPGSWAGYLNEFFVLFFMGLLGRVVWRKPTSIEKRMQFFLEELGFGVVEDFISEYPMRLGNGSRRIFDFYFPSRKLAIECDGTYWHRNHWKDAFKDVASAWSGVTVVRFTENDILKEATKVVKRLQKILLKNENRNL
jgi:hypothetical protein